MENFLMDNMLPTARKWTNLFPYLRSGLVRWLSATAGAACVLLLVARVAVAMTYAGPVTVTANMGSFSLNPVAVNKPATANLSANYNSPSGVSEGDLSAQYDWSVTNVQYKALQADAFGSPPSGSYTDSISPTQPSTSSSATLTFTPLIAGYWQVSASCGVTVTDTKTNQYWSGSANTAPPRPLTSYTLHIEYGGLVVDGQTHNVCVGQQIPLTADFGPSDMTLQWNVKGSTIGGYTANNQSASITPTGDLTKPTLSYYWMDTDSGSTEDENVTLTGTLPSGGSLSPVNTTFNVYRPVPTFTTQYLGPIQLVSGELYDGDIPDGGYDPRIEFDYSIPTSQFGDNYNLSTVQIVDVATVTTEQIQTGTLWPQPVTFEYTIPSSSVPSPVLDTSFPYGNVQAGMTNDSPNYPADPPPSGSGFGPGLWNTVNVIVSETFTHNLLFVPNVTNNQATTYAPLSQVSWGWNAEADNGVFGFSLVSSAKLPANPPTGSDLPTLPIWNSNAVPAWKNPQWFIISIGN